ncbi:hypothetical protein ACIGCH_00720 [Pseudomonas helleri]|uniref:Uncharacterized protein n=1 Tax=Pseudomonas helleri TaxID=1608996 RepID=A0A7X1Y0I8_9PSED|nr:hypothetical protein [Pseudomonas helleri]MQU26968.1 hypothetical protein [Pseudomonas helleri]
MSKSCLTVIAAFFFCLHNFCMANDSSTLPVQFELCGEAQSNAIHQLNTRPKSVATIVNNKTAKVIFVQLDGASLMISCDAEEKRMVIERTEEEGDLAYGLRG